MITSLSICNSNFIPLEDPESLLELLEPFDALPQSAFFPLFDDDEKLLFLSDHNENKVHIKFV